MDYQAARERFGSRLQTLRTERLLTQEQLGEAIEKSTEHISYLERGERSPSFELLFSLARVFETSVAELLDEQAISASTLVEVIPLPYHFRNCPNTFPLLRNSAFQTSNG